MNYLAIPVKSDMTPKNL